MSNQFKVEDHFLIRGRGLVLTGYLIEGIVHKGMRISIPAFPRMLTIDGIEMIHANPRKPGMFGLLFLTTDADEIRLWKQLPLKDIVFDILE
jgi:hypothetical protein